MLRVGAILAGGRSSRMGGGHKFNRELGGITLFERVRQRLAPQVDILVASVAPDSHHYDMGVTTIKDAIKDAGPLAGLHSVLSWCEQVFGQALVVTVPADTPFIPVDLVERLEHARTRGRARLSIAVSSTGVHNAIGLWPSLLATSLELWLASADHRAIKDFLRGEHVALAEFHDEPDPFFNINTPNDLLEAARRLK